jgi:cytochrome bd-type quinol oxidase subunit 1
MPTTPVIIEPLTLAQLTEAKVDGAGVFDTLMRAASSHCELEYNRSRIKGQDYAQVYLSAMQSTLATATQFLLGKDKAYLEAQLTEAQVKIAEAQLKQEESKAELIAAQVLKTKQETTNLVQELENLKAQECLLKAQYDLTMVQKLQTTAQTSLVQQKIATEKAQTVAVGVDEDSIIGRQKALYKAQTDGFERDAEQKAAKALIDTWNVRRTTDEATVADATNMLNDATIGRVVLKMLDGIKA